MPPSGPRWCARPRAARRAAALSSPNSARRSCAATGICSRLHNARSPSTCAPCSPGCADSDIFRGVYRRAMDDPNWMQVESLTTYEVAPDGSRVKLNLLDAEGKPASLIVPLEALRVLALSMPKIVFHAVRQATGGDDALRLVHGVENW